MAAGLLVVAAVASCTGGSGDERSFASRAGEDEQHGDADDLEEVDEMELPTIPRGPTMEELVPGGGELVWSDDGADTVGADRSDAEGPDGDAGSAAQPNQQEPAEPDAGEDARDPDREAPASQHARRVAALRNVRCWAPAFGGVDPRELQGYELAVVDGIPDRDGWADVGGADVTRLHDDDVMVVAYLSVGTVENWRAHTAGLPASVSLDAVEGWEGERYADARRPEWRDAILSVVGDLAAAGFDGLYLDNLDVVEVHAATRSGVVELVRAIRDRFPDLALIAQNGLDVVDELPVDAIAHEDVFWRWDDGYRPSTRAERAPLVAGLRALRARGLPVFTLDYTQPGDPGAADAVGASRAEGFVPAVSVLDLNRPPHAPRCAGG